jgi:hypothetical protein
MLMKRGKLPSESPVDCKALLMSVYGGWPEMISNERLWKIMNQQPISIQIKRRKLGWIGHTVGKATDPWRSRYWTGIVRGLEGAVVPKRRGKGRLRMKPWKW